MNEKEKKTHVKDANEKPNMQLVLGRGIAVAKGITEFRNGQSSVLVINFIQEYRHLNRGKTIAFLEEIADASNTFAQSPGDNDPPY